MYTLLAHGALGIWDEVIFAAVTVIFFGFMIFSWWRSRAIEPGLTEEKPKNQPTTQDSDHFQLD
jgi:hypothetical protein